MASNNEFDFVDEIYVKKINKSKMKVNTFTFSGMLRKRETSISFSFNKRLISVFFSFITFNNDSDVGFSIIFA